MRVRKSAGGTLALVAACFFIVLIIGIAFFGFAKIFGGANELQSVADSAALNVAKQAMNSASLSATDDPALDLNGEFGGVLEEPNSQGQVTGKVTLYNYNRIIGQTIFVMSNVEQDNTSQAQANAEQVVSDARHIGNLLTSKIQSQIPDYFSKMASFDPIAMFGAAVGSVRFAQQPQQIAYVHFNKAGKSSPSNIFITPDQLASGNLGAIPTEPPITVNGQQRVYIQGYTPISMGGTEIMAVQVRPFENPHLISLDTFKQGVNPMEDGVPPNAFLVGAISKDQQTGQDVTRLAAAVVGGINGGSDSPASFSHGFIVISNASGLASPAVNVAGGDIFAGAYMLGTEFGLPGPAVAGPGPGCIPSIIAYKNQLHAAGWLDYRWQLPPPCIPVPHSICPPVPPCCVSEAIVGLAQCIKGPPGVDKVNAAMNVTGSEYCSDTGMGVNFMPDYCFDPTNMNNAAATFPYSQPPQTVNPSGSSLMAVEQVKLDVIRARMGLSGNPAGAKNAVRVNVSAPPTGLKIYSNPPANASAVPFSTKGTMMQLLQQCQATGPMLTRITQRLKQIHPTATNLNSILNTPIDMGETWAIYRDPADSPTLTASLLAQAPQWVQKNVNALHPDLQADGLSIAAGRNVPLDLSNGPIINGKGDGGFPHPFDYAVPSGGWSQDSAHFHSSSGSHGFLGVLEFQNTVVVGGGYILFYGPC